MQLKGNIFMKIIFYIIILISSPITFAQSLGMRLTMSQTMQISQRQELKIELTNKLMQSLKLRVSLEQKQKMSDDLEEAHKLIKKNLQVWINNGVIIEKTLYLDSKLDPIKYYSLSKKALLTSRKPNQSILEMAEQVENILFKGENSGLLLFFPDLGIFINEDLIPAEYLPFAVIHCHGVILFSNHFYGSIVEFLYAKKQGKLSGYLDWLRSTPSYIYKMENFFQHSEYGRTLDLRDNLSSLNSNTRWILKKILAFDGDEGPDDWVEKVPFEVVNEIKKVQIKLTKFDKLMDNFFQNASKIIKSLSPRKGTLKDQLEQINADFEEFLLEIKKIHEDGPLYSESLIANLKRKRVSISGEYVERLNLLQGMLVGNQYQNWILDDYINFDSLSFMRLSLSDIFPANGHTKKKVTKVRNIRGESSKKIKSIPESLQDFAIFAEKVIKDLHPWHGSQKVQLMEIQNHYSGLVPYVASLLSSSLLTSEQQKNMLQLWKEIQINLGKSYVAKINKLMNDRNLGTELENWLYHEDFISLHQLSMMSDELTELLSTKVILGDISNFPCEKLVVFIMHE